MFDKEIRDIEMKQLYERRRLDGFEIHLKIAVTLAVLFIWVLVFRDTFELIPPGIPRLIVPVSLLVGIVVGRFAVSIMCDKKRKALSTKQQEEMEIIKKHHNRV